MDLLEGDDECLVYVGYLSNTTDLPCRKPLGVQLQNAEISVNFVGNDAVTPSKGRTQPVRLDGFTERGALGHLSFWGPTQV